MQMKLGRYVTRGNDVVVIDEYTKPTSESNYLKKFCWRGYLIRDEEIEYPVNRSWDSAGRFMIDGSISQNDLVRYIGPLDTDKLADSDFRFARMIEAVHPPAQNFSGVVNNDE